MAGNVNQVGPVKPWWGKSPLTTQQRQGLPAQSVEQVDSVVRAVDITTGGPVIRALRQVGQFINSLLNYKPKH